MMQSILHKTSLRRLAALLLAAVLALCALPKVARAASGGEIHTLDNGYGLAALVPGSDTHATVVAVPRDPYVFDHWEVTGYYSGTFYGKQLTVPYPGSGNTVTFKAIFVDPIFAIHGVQAQVAPDQTGRGSASGTLVSTEIPKQAVTTTITAVPANGYVFSDWVRESPYYAQFYESSMQVTAPAGELHAYTAYFVAVDADDAFGAFTRVEAIDSSGTPIAGATPGTATGDRLYNPAGGPGQQTTLQAFPASDAWVFDHWKLSSNGTDKGQVSAANPYTVKVEKYTKDVYTAVFRQVTGANGVFTTVTGLKADGTAETTVTPGTATGDRLYNPAGGTGQQTTLQAFPASEEWVFDHWARKRDDGTQSPISTANPYTVSVEAHRDVYVAVFKAAAGANGVFTTVTGIRADGTPEPTVTPGTATGARLYNPAGGPGQQTTLQAFPTSEEWVFDHWERKRDTGSPSPISNANPYTVSVEAHRDEYTAVFKAAAGAGGVFTKTDDPAVIDGTTTGDRLYNPAGGPNQQTTIQAFGTEGYVFREWTVEYGDGHLAVFTENPLTVKVENRHDVYTASFDWIGDHGVYTQPDDRAHGTTSGDAKYIVNGQRVTQTTIQAFPASDDWVFDHWELTHGLEARRPVSTANPYTVKVENIKDVYTAVFKPAADSKGVHTAVKAVNADGTEIPGATPGTTSGDTKHIVNGARVNQTTLQAFPSSNDYIFIRWEWSRDGVAQGQASAANPYTVAVEDHSDLYTAVFMVTPDNTPVPITPEETGIADGPFKDVWRKLTDPNYGTTRGKLIDLAWDVINRIRSRYVGASPYMGESAAAAQLQEQLAEKDLPKDRGDMAALPEGELVSSKGEPFGIEEIGKQEHEDSAAAVVEQRFGSLYGYEILRAVDMTAPIRRTYGTRTMVWKQTGATEKDRLLLLQFMQGGVQNVVTPVADENGTVTFSLPSAVDSRLVLLRVFINAE